MLDEGHISTISAMRRSRSQREPVRRLTPGLPFESPLLQEMPAVSQTSLPHMQPLAAPPALWQDPRVLQQQRQQQQQQQLLQQQHMMLEQQMAQQAQARGQGLPDWAQSGGDRQAQLQQMLREQQQQEQQRQFAQQRQRLSDAVLAGQEQQQGARLQAAGQAGYQATYAPWAQFPGPADAATAVGPPAVPAGGSTGPARPATTTRPWCACVAGSAGARDALVPRVLS